MAVPTKTEHSGRTVVHDWSLTTADATGDAISVPGSSDRTVQFIADTAGSATCILEGSLDADPDTGTFTTLTDGQGNAISGTSTIIEMVAENVLFVRPRLSTVGSGALWSVRLFSRSTMR